MAYCSNCGTMLSNEVNFCFNCGAKVLKAAIEQKKTYRKEYAQKMYKNTVQTLENKSKRFIQNRVQESISKAMPKPATPDIAPPPLIKDTASVSPPPPPVSSVEKKKRGGVDAWTWIYMIISLIIFFAIPYDQLIRSALVLSAVILLIVFIRIKKEKPYNWLAKLVLIIQTLAFTIIFIDHAGYFYPAPYYIFNIASVILMILIDLRLLFKGNKKTK